MPRGMKYFMTCRIMSLIKLFYDLVRENKIKLSIIP